jgi:hypothetical protein
MIEVDVGEEDMANIFWLVTMFSKPGFEVLKGRVGAGFEEYGAR